MLSVFLSIHAQEVSEDEIIAKINGKSIFYREIMLSQDLQNRYLRSKYREKLKELTDDEINKLILLEEKKRLLERMKHIIKEEKIKKWQISVTSEEINNRIESSLKDNNLSIEGLSKKMKEGDRALLKALSTYLKDPQREDEIYTELRQKYGYSKLAWNNMKEKYNTPEKLERLKEKMQITISSFKEEISGNFRSMILNEKFENYITKDILVSESELKEFYRQQYPLAEDYPEADIPRYNEVKDILAKKLLERKKEEKIANWWLAEFKKANIKILDERYKDFMDLLETPQEMELSGGDLQESKPKQEKPTHQPSTPEDKDTTQAKEETTKEPKPEEQQSTNHSTLHLKDGRTIAGIITKEDPNTIKINTGVIEYTISKDEIDRIE